ncbi:DUF6194 family protein [Nakamurella deserti]|uniref:DUF6194 family protein n=1 Tax=Nakamurella deserti TaxID=2164074 RepID=UPI000DBE03F8|nr:DUF6194 family protein [Nakamurella deserti]
MTVDDIAAWVEGLGGVLTLRPAPGDGSPALAHGDLFFYWAPDGVLPPGQPFATVVTKDYPGEPSSGLDRPGAFRVNVAAGSEEFRRRTGVAPHDATPGATPDDEVVAHPVYAALGWLCVVNPGERAAADLRDLLTAAHGLARGRRERRQEI